MYSKWINDGVHKPGKSAAKLAKALGHHRGTVYKMIAGTREIRLDELPVISKYIEEPVPMPFQTAITSGELVTIPIEYKVGVGCWHEAGVSTGNNLGVITAPRDTIYKAATHKAYVFSGDSMVYAGILDGDILIGVEPDKNITTVTGNLVIVSRDRAGVVEMSARIITVLKDKIEYKVASPNETYKPIIVANKGKHTEEVRVVAVIRRISRDLR